MEEKGKYFFKKLFWVISVNLVNFCKTKDEKKVVSSILGISMGTLCILQPF